MKKFIVVSTLAGFLLYLPFAYAKSYSGGSSSSSTSRTPSISSGSRSSSSVIPSTRGYSGGSSPTLTPSPTLPSTNKYSATAPLPSGSWIPPKSNYDNSYNNVRQQQQSMNNWTKAQPRVQPSPQQPLQLSRDDYATRSDRSRNVYNNYYSRPAPSSTIIYRDSTSFNPYFWLWLADRNDHDQAEWLVRHEQEIDSARMQAMMANNANLRAEIDTMKKNGVAADPNYVPAGIQSDLMYDDKVVAQESSNWGSVLIVIVVLSLATMVIIFILR